jgi:hypothetical protein
MLDKGSKPLRDVAEMTREEIIADSNSADNWAFRGVGMLQCAYTMYRSFSERFGLGSDASHPGSNVIPRDIIYSYINCYHKAYMLLAGVAMENLAKGLLVATKVVEGKLPKWFFTHDALRLLKEADFQLEQYDSHALTNATEARIWKAQYPLPIDAKNLSTFAQNSSLGLATELWGQTVVHPVYFLRLATRILLCYPKKALPGDSISVSDLIHILEGECPPFEHPKI